MNRRLYALHRWVSLAALVQLAIWTASGTFFAVVPIGKVRGTSVPKAHERTLSAGVATSSTALLPASEVLTRAAAAGLDGITSLELRDTPSGVFWFAATSGGKVRLSASGGHPVPVDRSEAEATAQRDQPGSPAIVSAELVERDAPIEYREKPLPAWRVRVVGADSGMNVWVDARTGDVTARRNDVWRVYDFLWALHIMDYSERESFNHPLIIAAALLGVGTVLTGAVLWALRWSRR
ncbi:PepSY domain-containing protein [Myxococcota bacterium]|nr:PepSY domain-containing protein [Myxococcota bacterium]